jgi:hypothetical protein
VLLSLLQTKDGLERCLIAPWTRSKLDEELARAAERTSDTQLGNQWTSVNDNLVEVQETKTDPSPSLLTSGLGGDQTTNAASGHGVLNDCMIEYLTMLQRSRGANASGMEHQSVSSPAMAIEGSLKLAQHVRFPTQRVAGTSGMSIPQWYASLRDAVDKENQNSSETSAIRSVSSLSQGKSFYAAAIKYDHHKVLTHELIRLSCIVYGLSVIEDPTLVDSRVSKDTVVVGQKADPSPKADDTAAPDLDNESLLHSTEVSSCCFCTNFCFDKLFTALYVFSRRQSCSEAPTLVNGDLMFASIPRLLILPCS